MASQCNVARLFGTNTAPTETERQFILDVVEQNEHELRILRSDIENLRRQMDGLLQKERLIMDKIAVHRELISPFRSLPDDIVREIFFACLPTSHNPIIDIHQAPLLLTRISQRTRHIALTTPRLWAALHIPFSVHGEPSPEGIYGVEDIIHFVLMKRSDAVQEWLGRRSGACDLTVSIYEDDDEFMVEVGIGIIFDTIVAASPRLRHLSLVCPYDCLEEFLSRLVLSLPRLESLVLSVNHTDFKPNQSVSRLFNASAARNAPLLSDLSLDAPIEILGNLASYHINWSHLHHLSLGCKESPVQISQAMQILALSSQLCSCKLHLDYIDPTIPVQKVSLPNLEAVSLSSNNGIPLDIFSGFFVPVLKRITYEIPVSGPLLNLISKTGSRITHLSLKLTWFSQVASCLEMCPGLIALELAGMNIWSGSTNEDRKWSKYSDNGLSMGQRLLQCFMTANSGIAVAQEDQTSEQLSKDYREGKVVPKRLCQQLRYLSYQPAYDYEVPASIIMAFINDKCTQDTGSSASDHKLLRGLHMGLRGSSDYAKSIQAIRDSYSAKLRLVLTCEVVDGKGTLELPLDSGIPLVNRHPSWWPWCDAR